jgi:hypothetical protein
VNGSSANAFLNPLIQKDWKQAGKLGTRLATLLASTTRLPQETNMTMTFPTRLVTIAAALMLSALNLAFLAAPAEALPSVAQVGLEQRA